MAKITNWYSNEWCKDNHARSQEELQKMAKAIRTSCKCMKIVNHNNDDGHACTVYVNENLGIRYWIHDDFGKIETITEERNY